jgi:hypothetical protein
MPLAAGSALAVAFQDDHSAQNETTDKSKSVQNKQSIFR